jgi:hypothetical protein
MPQNHHELAQVWEGLQRLNHADDALNVLGLVAWNTGNYEEALSLGHCTGEIVLNAMLRMGQELGVMGEGEGP